MYIHTELYGWQDMGEWVEIMQMSIHICVERQLLYHEPMQQWQNMEHTVPILRMPIIQCLYQLDMPATPNHMHQWQSVE